MTDTTAPTSTPGPRQLPPAQPFEVALTARMAAPFLDEALELARRLPASEQRRQTIAALNHARDYVQVARAYLDQLGPLT